MKINYWLIIFAFLSSLIKTKAYSAEQSAGVVASLYQPNYSVFSNQAQSNGNTKFPARMLLIGGETTFLKRGLITGGRVLYGTTKAETGYFGNAYSVANLGLKMGYGVNFSDVVGFSVNLLAGPGYISYSLGSQTKGGIVESSYIFLEPTILIDLYGAGLFKFSFGGGYHYPFIYSVNLYGDELVTDTSTIAAGGVNILLQLSFGIF